jgi:DNA repair ATPase RecN
LDHSVFVTTEENLINTADAWTTELIGVGKELSEATLDRDKRDEKELATTLKDLDHLRHLAEYYKRTIQTIVYLKGEFEKAYNEFKKERHLLTVKILEFQEDTLMALTTCKDMERWYERVQQVVERLKYIGAVQQG